MFINFSTASTTSQIKSFVTASIFAILMLGGLNGCQSMNSQPIGQNVPVTTPQPSQATSLPQISEMGSSDQPYQTNPNEPSLNDNAQNQDPYPSSHQTQLPSSSTLPNNHAGYEDQTGDNTTEAPTSTAQESSPVVPSSSPTHTSSGSSPVTPNQVIITPPAPDAKTTQQRLLEQARQNSQTTPRANTSLQDGSNIPAFQKLMDTGVAQLRQGQVSAAESTFTRAQRLAPQSAAVYFYLGQVALKQNQPMKAEAMARRGLVVAQSQSRKKALWQVILKAAQAQGNIRVINEANAALAN